MLRRSGGTECTPAQCSAACNECPALHRASSHTHTHRPLGVCPSELTWYRGCTITAPALLLPHPSNARETAAGGIVRRPSRRLPMRRPGLPGVDAARRGGAVAALPLGAALAAAVARPVALTPLRCAPGGCRQHNRMFRSEGRRPGARRGGTKPESSQEAGLNRMKALSQRLCPIRIGVPVLDPNAATLPSRPSRSRDSSSGLRDTSRLPRHLWGCGGRCEGPIRPTRAARRVP